MGSFKTPMETRMRTARIGDDTMAKWTGKLENPIGMIARAESCCEKAHGSEQVARDHAREIAEAKGIPLEDIRVSAVCFDE